MKNMDTTPTLIWRNLSFWILGFFFLFWCGEGVAAPKNGDKFGDWTFGCQASKTDRTQCMLTQDISLKKGGGLIVRGVLGRFGVKKGLAFVVIVPLGIYLPAGVAIKIDTFDQVAMQVKRCIPQGCEAVLPLDKQLTEQFKQGEKLFVGFKVRANEETKIVPISLKGTLKGIEILKTTASSRN